MSTRDAEAVAAWMFAATTATTTLVAPGSAAAGTSLILRFTGPCGSGCLVTIVAADAPGDVQRWVR